MKAKKKWMFLGLTVLVVVAADRNPQYAVSYAG